MKHTEEQIKVFNFVKGDSGNGIIDAVAGSGKTTTIVDSAAYIDTAKKIIFCAFNRSIAAEIKGRFLKKGLRHIVVKTMHALGNDMLKSNAETPYEFDNYKYNKIIDTAVRHNFHEIIKELLRINNIEVEPRNSYDETQQKNYIRTFKETLLNINTKFRLTLAKNTVDELKELVVHYNIFKEKKTDTDSFNEEIGHYFKANEYILEQGNMWAKKLSIIDYSDMLYLPFEWKLYPINQCDLLFIDECQDLSKSQLAVALKYVKGAGRVISVGDPYQSIYGFTGADIESFENIKSLKNTITLRLSKCFRCPDNIIELAQKFREDIVAFAPKQGSIIDIEFKDVVDNAKPKNLIICRTKAPLQVLMFTLLEKNIEIKVPEDEIKDFINDIRFIFSKEELTETGIYKDEKTNDFFEKVRSRNTYFIEKDAKKIKDKEDQENRISEETQLLNAKLKFIEKQLVLHPEIKNIDELLKRLARLIEGGENAIQLSTIHRAKGLENDVVFILDYDRLPRYRDDQKEWERRQEKNLKYVALTRAKNILFLVKSPKLNDIANQSSLFDLNEGLW